MRFSPPLPLLPPLLLLLLLLHAHLDYHPALARPSLDHSSVGDGDSSGANLGESTSLTRRRLAATDGVAAPPPATFTASVARLSAVEHSLTRVPAAAHVVVVRRRRAKGRHDQRVRMAVRTRQHQLPHAKHQRHAEPAALALLHRQGDALLRHARLGVRRHPHTLMEIPTAPSQPGLHSVAMICAQTCQGVTDGRAHERVHGALPGALPLRRAVCGFPAHGGHARLSVRAQHGICHAPHVSAPDRGNVSCLRAALATGAVMPSVPWHAGAGAVAAGGAAARPGAAPGQLVQSPGTTQRRGSSRPHRHMLAATLGVCQPKEGVPVEDICHHRRVYNAKEKRLVTLEEFFRAHRHDIITRREVGKCSSHAEA
eukprot:scaffold359_cov313-Prasinococcus_capsulatus_cf.AAC.3